METDLAGRRGRKPNGLGLGAHLYRFAATAHNEIRQELHGRDSAHPDGLRDALALQLRDIDRCPNGSGDIDHEHVAAHFDPCAATKRIVIRHRASVVVAESDLLVLKNQLLTAAYTQHGQDLAAMFRGYDTNRDGKLVLSEIGLVIQRMVPGILTDAQLGFVLADMDRDGSGCVSLLELGAWCGAEVAVATAGLGSAGFDANGDGMLQASELQDVLDARAAEGAGVSAAAAEGDARMYEPEQLVARYKLRQHPAVLLQLARWWEASKRELDSNDNGVMDREEYSVLHKRLVRAFAEDGNDDNDLTPEQEEAALEEDWSADKADDGSEHLTQVDLFDAVFALADAWTEGTEVHEYVDFLALLFTKVFGRFQRRVRRFLTLRHLQDHHDEAHPEAAGGARGFGHGRGGGSGQRGRGAGARWGDGPQLSGWGDGGQGPGVFREGEVPEAQQLQQQQHWQEQHQEQPAQGGGAPGAAAAYPPGASIPVQPAQDPERAAARRRPLTQAKKKDVNKYAPLPPIVKSGASAAAARARRALMRNPTGHGHEWSPFNHCRCGKQPWELERSYDDSDDDVEFDVEFD